MGEIARQADPGDVDVARQGRADLATDDADHLIEHQVLEAIGAGELRPTAHKRLLGDHGRPVGAIDLKLAGRHLDVEALQQVAFLQLVEAGQADAAFVAA